jgi:hypothetical protein
MKKEHCQNTLKRKRAEKLAREYRTGAIEQKTDLKQDIIKRTSFLKPSKQKLVSMSGRELVKKTIRIQNLQERDTAK